jgi:putative DNA methylase
VENRADKPRLIERGFPLKQASLDSVHEKNVRHGHISTLHIWPARRPLAACRAALIATLLPDPGDPEERRRLLERIGGRVISKLEKKKVNGKPVEVEREETVGGILHWGRESSPDLQAIREEIREAYGGRAPRVLDPFAGGGAIPLEAMRLGCEVTAIDINPVAWFILKCTLEYPQKLAGQKRPLPDFVLRDREFMESFYKAQGIKGATLRTQLERLGLDGDDAQKPAPDRRSGQNGDFGFDGPSLEADLAWHVRAWGRWVLARARADLERFYPTIDGKPTVAYLWARTVKCKNCRATIPLLKTKWLCKKDNKRVLLDIAPNADKTGPVFGIVSGKDAAPQGGNSAQRREYDKKLGLGTMSRAGTTCVCCGLPSMKMDDIQAESNTGRSGLQLMAVVAEGRETKEYRLPMELELAAIDAAAKRQEQTLAKLSGHSLDEAFEPTSTRSISAQLYGVRKWRDLFTPRQRLSLATLGLALHSAAEELASSGTPELWIEAVTDVICLSLDRLTSFMCVNTRWKTDADSMTDAFSRFSISLLWDFAEANPLGTTAGGFLRCNERIATALDTLATQFQSLAPATVLQQSASEFDSSAKFDLIITDPPYYQAVSYADLSDFFYAWLRGFEPRDLPQFHSHLTEKSREFVQHIREDKSREREKAKYEHQMAEAFVKARRSLADNGRFICVFAHKEPDAWETLVSAIIASGFVVTASWPVQTEMPSRQRGARVAALSSSVWLVCRPRAETARPGWDNRVLDEMRENIFVQLREFWDAGIRGPDFVWAATGPALEAYSKHPVVKKADEPGALMEVSEFLRAVRRIVVDFVVGRVLSYNGEAASVSGLDDVTTYYLLHRNDFKLEDAPIGACILYAISCGLSDHDLADRYEILQRTGGQSEPEEDEEPSAEADAEVEEGTGSKVRLRPWNKRIRKAMGYDGDSAAAVGKPAPLIDQVHRLMLLWRAGDVVKVDEYVETRALKRNAVFHQLLQALIELAPAASEERSLLESISNHISARPASAEERQADMFKHA